MINYEIANIIESTLAIGLENDLPLSELVNTAPVVERTSQLSEKDDEFRVRYMAELWLSRGEVERKLTQLERLSIFYAMKKAEGTLPATKTAIVAAELAIYYGCPSHRVMICQGCTLYLFKKSGLAGLMKNRKDEEYHEIEEEVTSWVYER